MAEGYQTGVSLPFEDIVEDQVERFRKDVADRITKLESILERLPLMTTTPAGIRGIDSINVSREGVFFEGQYFDALQLVKKILSDAQRSIIIIDAYVNGHVLNLLTSKETAVEVNILTKTVSPLLKTEATAFNKQHGKYGKLSIRASHAFHDRFLFIDDKDFYHFGASLKDLGHGGFMFSRLEDPKEIEKVRREFAQEWAKSPLEV